LRSFVLLSLFPLLFLLALRITVVLYFVILGLACVYGVTRIFGLKHFSLVCYDFAHALFMLDEFVNLAIAHAV